MNDVFYSNTLNSYIWQDTLKDIADFEKRQQQKDQYLPRITTNTLSLNFFNFPIASKSISNGTTDINGEFSFTLPNITLSDEELTVQFYKDFFTVTNNLTSDRFTFELSIDDVSRGRYRTDQLIPIVRDRYNHTGKILLVECETEGLFNFSNKLGQLFTIQSSADTTLSTIITTTTQLVTATEHNNINTTSNSTGQTAFFFENSLSGFILLSSVFVFLSVIHYHSKKKKQ